MLRLRPGSRSCRLAACIQLIVCKQWWLAEHGLHSDSGYLPKELMGQRDRLSDKDFKDTIASKIQLLMQSNPPIPSSYCSEHKDMIQHSPLTPYAFAMPWTNSGLDLVLAFIHCIIDTSSRPIIHSTHLIPSFLCQSSMQTSTTAILATPSSNRTHTQCLSLLAS